MAHQELEVKFIVNQPALSLWKGALQRALSDAGFSVLETKQQTLINTYYDTSDHIFEQLKMGMRVRGCDGKYEQTLKTQKAVNAGMHERNEFNIDLISDAPDLTLFPADAWPEDLEQTIASLVLVPQFTTNFTRKTVLLQSDHGKCELVFDEGVIETDNDSSILNEVEIELLQGEASVLMQVAKCLSSFSMRLSDVSKAAQGYGLLNGVPSTIRPLPSALRLDDNATTENVFSLCCETAMAHWQHHEHLFFTTQRAKMLPEIATGIRLSLQCLALFLPVMQCQPMLNLQRDLLNFSEKWLWVDDLKSMRFLLSRKGPFYKTLSRQTAVMSYLQGRVKGELSAHDPQSLLTSREATDIKLNMIELLMNKPWRTNTVDSHLPVVEHARGWLSQGWQTLHQTMQSTRPLPPTNYTAVETLMRQTLFNGFILSDLFPQSGPVRAPWLDLLVGIEEIRALQLLKQSIREAELDYEDGLELWIDEKLFHLLHVMERTRQVALNKNMYW